MYYYYVAFWNILQPFGIFYDHLVIWWQFGMFTPVLVYWVKKNLATLLPRTFLGLGTSWGQCNILYVSLESIFRHVSAEIIFSGISLSFISSWKISWKKMKKLNFTIWLHFCRCFTCNIRWQFYGSVSAVIFGGNVSKLERLRISG
jgi:hypothetical protein